MQTLGDMREHFLPEAPAYCENRDEFAQLRDVQAV